MQTVELKTSQRQEDLQQVRFKDYGSWTNLIISLNFCCKMFLHHSVVRCCTALTPILLWWRRVWPFVEFEKYWFNLGRWEIKHLHHQTCPMLSTSIVHHGVNYLKKGPTMVLGSWTQDTVHFQVRKWLLGPLQHSNFLIEQPL